jgi:hypothetical protein
MINFVKGLSASEAKYKYVGLPKSVREKFPEKDISFKVKFKGKIYDLKVNNKNCIMLTQLYEKYLFKENDTIRIIEIKKNIFDFNVE